MTLRRGGMSDKWAVRMGEALIVLGWCVILIALGLGR